MNVPPSDTSIYTYEVATGCLVLAARFLLALLYVPDLGRGFLKDDCRWIAEGRITSVRDVWHVLTVNVAPYRPLVTHTFSADFALFDLHALPATL